MKQLIVLENIQGKTALEVAEIICDASMAFVRGDLKHNAYLFSKHKTYPCRKFEGYGHIAYKDVRLDSISRDNFMAGRKRFAVKETYENGELVNIEEVPDENIYDCNIEIAEDVYDEWLFKGMPKVVAVGHEAMNIILNKANQFTFKKHVEYFQGKHGDVKYLTFVPMDDNVVKNMIQDVYLYQ